MMVAEEISIALEEGVGIESWGEKAVELLMAQNLPSTSP